MTEKQIKHVNYLLEANNINNPAIVVGINLAMTQSLMREKNLVNNNINLANAIIENQHHFEGTPVDHCVFCGVEIDDDGSLDHYDDCIIHTATMVLEDSLKTESVND